MNLPTLLAQQESLTVGGWIMMVGCIGIVLGLCTFCFWHLLRESRPSEHHHVPLDINTRNTED